MDPKRLLMRLMGAIGHLPLIPFSLQLRLARKYRGLRFLLPPGQEFIFDHYLEDIRVNINTLYPMEVEMITGVYDPKTSAVIKRFVQENDVVMDIGANVGALTLLLAKMAHQGRVVAIEPGPTTYSRLESNLSLNPKLQDIVDAHQLGIADKPGELFWKEDQNVKGNAGLLQSEGHRVRVQSLDELVANLALSKLNFIKIDVEGMEYEVIKGGLRSITKYRPLIYYETLESFRQIRGFDVYGEIYSYLQELEYQHFCVLSQGRIKPIANLNVLQSPNTLAIPKEKLS